LVYSGAGLECVMGELGGEFENDTAVDVDIIYGGSGHIFGLRSTSRRGIVEGFLYERQIRLKS